MLTSGSILLKAHISEDKFQNTYIQSGPPKVSRGAKYDTLGGLEGMTSEMLWIHSGTSCSCQKKSSIFAEKLSSTKGTWCSF